MQGARIFVGDSNIVMGISVDRTFAYDSQIQVYSCSGDFPISVNGYCGINTYFGIQDRTEISHYNNEGSFGTFYLAKLNKISGNIRFDETSGGDILISDINLDGELRVDRGTFDNVEISRSNISKLFLVNSLESRSFRLHETDFPSKVIIDVEGESISLSSARFRRGGRVTFGGCRMDLRGLTADEELSISGVSSNGMVPEVRSVSNADMKNVSISNVNMGRCAFSDCHGLAQVTLKAVRFAAPPRSHWYHRACVADEFAYRSSRGFEGWTMRGALLGNVDPYNTKAIRWPVVGASDVGHVYRSLRRSYEAQGDYPKSMDFYFGEMEMKRIDRSNPITERVIIYLYWLISGYGQSISRAFISIAAIWFVTLIAMWAFGFEHSRSLPEAAVFSFQAMIPSVRTDWQLSTAGEYIRTLLAIAGPVMIGLAFLAIRSRLKR